MDVNRDSKKFVLHGFPSYYVWKDLSIKRTVFAWISFDFGSDLDSRRPYNQVSGQIKNEISESTERYRLMGNNDPNQSY